jgi:hypothetical protein
MERIKRTVFLSCVFSLILTMASPLFAVGSVSYRLLPGSTLTDGCFICDRIPWVIPIEGGFSLETLEPNPLFDPYAVRNLSFRGTWFDQDYVGRFDGSFQIGGEVAITWQADLSGRIGDRAIRLTGYGVPAAGMLPWIDIVLEQVEPSPDKEPAHVFTLHLLAAPWPGELAFSTQNGFTSTNPSLGTISGGDLLSTNGKIIRRNRELTAKLGIMPIVPDVGLDAILRPSPKAWIGGGFYPCDLWFSIEKDILSETLGTLHHGDLLSDRGKVVKTNSDLLSPFSPMPPITDVGLDAICEGPDGGLLFSTRSDFFSETLGQTVGHGDLLNSNGTIFKTNKELLANFHPLLVVPNEFSFGLDAAYVWPNGEVWFSVENGFTDVELGPISDGDLLSSVGRVVMKNLELLRAFKPIEDDSNFGLDAIAFVAPQPVGDLNYDCAVRLDDFAAFAEQWLRKDCLECGGADFSGDNQVAIDDLVIFAEHWMMDYAGPKLWQWWGNTLGPIPPADAIPNLFAMEVRGAYVYLTDIVAANCAVKGMELTLALDGTRIHVVEEEIIGYPSYCLAQYPVTGIVGPLAPGSYLFDVNRHTDAGCKLVTMKSITIKPWLEYQVLPCMPDEAIPPADATQRFSVAVQDRMIELTDRIVANCCAENIRLSVDVVGSEITLTETETADNPCLCLCSFPTKATVGPFKAGTYTVAVVQQDAGGNKLIGTEKVTID